MRILTSLLLIFLTHTSYTQAYIGGGQNSGISVTASSQHNQSKWPKAASAINTINGTGLDAARMEASRFLNQASLGFDKSHIDDVVSLGIEGWIDQQMQLPQTLILPRVEEIYQITLDSMAAKGAERDISEFRPRWWDFNYAWWEQTMRNDDLLRHRVAFALSQIFVISRPELSSYGDGLGSFYDMLAKNAFGNYEDLLRDVTLHPCMGAFLSHLSNPRSNSELNIHPDENFAREIMQLFSIGLYELNLDGTRITKANGDFIPTYGQADIKEFAKVFTGLGVSDTVSWTPYPWPNNLYFEKSLWEANVTVPMMMYEYQHEPGPKTLLKGFTIPAGQNGMQDINDAIHNLATHPNVGPFISYRLIQRLVKSNPSPAYISRVSQVFNNNGNGVRGDLAAVIKAILLDGEARACAFLSDDHNSRLKEPLIKYTHFARSVDKYHPLNNYWHANDNFANNVGQDIFASPSVFNFYLPDHQPNGDIADQGLVAPEFNLHNTLTAPGYMNEVDNWIVSWGNMMYTWEGEWMDNTQVYFDINYFENLAADTETLINELDQVFTHGNLSDNTRQLLRNSLNQMNPVDWDGYPEYRVRIAVYIILISPDYAVMR